MLHKYNIQCINVIPVHERAGTQLEHASLSHSMHIRTKEFVKA